MKVPYFQLAISLDDGSGQALETALQNLEKSGLEYRISSQNEKESLLIWNIEVLNVTQANEQEWFELISAYCQKESLACRFRFPSFLKVNKSTKT